MRSSGWKHIARRVAARQGQRGFTIAELSIALLLSGIIAVGTMQTKLKTDKLMNANTAADVLNAYKGALNTYTNENYIALQGGQPVSKQGVTLAPGTAAGQSMHPDIPSLIAMGYLPVGFTGVAFEADNATFDNQIVLLPAGCVTLACNVRGLAWITQPIVQRNSGGSPDGPVLGQMMQRIGGDAGVSDETAPGTIGAAGAGWTWANPVPGQPAGVIATQFGFDASALGQFVRINDTRDPNLQGNLTANGDLSIGGSTSLAGATTIGGALTINNSTTANGTITLNNAGGTNCINLDRDGIVTISCTGLLNARTGVFTDGVGNTTTIGPNGIAATGRVAGAQGLSTASGTVFDATDPYAITVTAGQQFFRGSSGSLTLMTLDNGDVVAGKNVAAQRLALQSIVVPGAACANNSGAIAGATTEYASTGNGGLAVCSGGVWASLTNRATANSPCSPNGSIATDVGTGGGLICKGGYYISADSMISNYVMGTPFQVTGDNFTVSKSSVIACDALGAGTGIPLIYILPSNEASANSAFARSAVDSNPGSNSGSWTFSMKDGAGNPLTSMSAIAIPMCYYN